jgi:hypothetical protein
VKNIPSKSLKLLPILGVPSLPSLPLPFIPGLRPANSAVLLGDNGPVGLCLWDPSFGNCAGRLATGAVELAEESEVCDCCATSIDFFVGALRPIFLGSPLSVALGSL